VAGGASNKVRVDTDYRAQRFGERALKAYKFGVKLGSG